MAAPTKKRALAQKNEELEDKDSDEEELDDSGENYDSDDEEEVEQEIQVEFEAQTAIDSDFHGIKKLLQQVFLKANVNTGELSDTVIAQNYVGSVIKQVGLSDTDDLDPDLDEDEDENEVYGVITVLNIAEKKDLGCVQDIRKLLSDRCKQCAANQFDRFHQLLDEKQTGYLISERFINIPAQLAPPMYAALQSELKKASERGMKFEFEYFLLICKTYQTRAENRVKNKAVQRFFINAEEEIFHQAAALTFEYNVTQEKDTVVGGEWDDETEEFDLYRTVVVVEKSKFDECVSRIQEMYS